MGNENGTAPRSAESAGRKHARTASITTPSAIFSGLAPPDAAPLALVPFLGSVQLDTPVRSLSGGYKRRLALAIQLVRDPYVLCLDEPLAGLDWMARAEVTKLLANLRRERAVVVVSHDVEEIAPVADRAWRMGPGGILHPEPELAQGAARAFGDAASEFSGFM